MINLLNMLDQFAGTLAAPVLLGMILNEAALPPLQSLAEGPSTVFCVAEMQRIHLKQAA